MGTRTSQFQHWASQFQHWASDYSGPNIYMLGPILAPVQFRNWAPSSGTGTSPNEHCVHFWLHGSPVIQVCVLKSAQCLFGVLWAPSARTGLVPDWVPTYINFIFIRPVRHENRSIFYGHRSASSVLNQKSFYVCA
jgi:hypothetical protein